MPRPDRSEPIAGSSRHHEYKAQPPRPPNAWILYRSNKFAIMRDNNERVSQGVVSQMVADMWKSEDEGTKRYWERAAEDEKARHQELYPGYRYCPKKKEEKIREREDRKQSRLAKKSKARDATLPTGADTNASPAPQPPTNTNAGPTLLPPPPVHCVPQPYVVPDCNSNMVFPQHHTMPYVPEARYDPCGPSPPISAAPSPVPSFQTESRLASSSSSYPPALPSPSESRVSTSSYRPTANQFFPSSLPSSQNPSPNPFATQPLPTLLFETSAPLVEGTGTQTAPIWNDVPNQPTSFNSQNMEVLNFDIPINQTQNFANFQQNVLGTPFDPLHGLLSDTHENGAFNLSSISTTNLLSPPQGELEIAMGPQAPTVDYNDELFANFDFVQLEQQMASLTEAGLSSAPTSAQEDLQSLFRTSNNSEVQAYMATRQRQPSAFTQDMLNFLNFEAAEGSMEDTSSAITPAPIPSTVVPQQVRIQSPQDAASMPIFTQMTNVPTDTAYVPPAGAIYSSTRRVAASWKPPLATPSHMDEPIQPWSLYTN